MTVILVILLFVVLIFPHELGHFLAAKACKVQVNEFSFGMGPAIWKKQGEKTLYSIRAIPIGGYCAMEGEDREESGDNPAAFNNKKWWQKIIILLAGAGMNVLIAIMALSIAIGVTGFSTNEVSSVQKGSPAAQIALKEGDVITHIDNKPVKSLTDIQKNVQSQDEVTLTVEHKGQTVKKVLKPRYIRDEKRYIIGINGAVSHNPVKALSKGVKMTGSMTVKLFDSLKTLVSSPSNFKEVSGPVGMVSVVNQTKDMGFVFYMFIVAFISLNLAVINLLPLPALDGGRIIFVFIRKITGKAISDKIEGKVHAVGMMLLFALMIFATWNDILRIFK